MAYETILIVEDDGILAAFLQDTLTGFGYTALQPVATGEEAIAKAAAQKPQLVLMDIELAGEMNGITAAEHIQSASDIPIIYLSGYSQYPLLQKAKVVAPYGYLVKPVPVEELAAMIEMALYKHILDRRVRENEERFRTIYENAPILIDGFDKNGRCILWNKECEKTFGYTMEEVKSHDHPLLTFYPYQDVREEVMESVTSKPETIFREWHPITKDGKEVVTLWANFQLPDGTIMNIGYDITARKRAEEALRQRSLELQQLTETLEQRVLERTAELATTNEALRHLSTKLLSAQEDERKRIAGELHDTIGSCLNAIKFKVETVQQQIGNTANVTRDALNTIIPIVQESIDECRRIQMDLRPSMLDDLGLLPTLSWFFRRFQTIYSEIRIEQEIEIKEGDVPPPLKIVVFRVIQETMNNIAKHSHANLVRLSLRKLNDRMELILQDNGQGFNLDKAHSKKTTKRGLGLSSMRERTELSGGSFDIESTEGKGAIIRASWPLQENG